MRKHGGLADWALTELVALLDSLAFSIQRLNLNFSGTCSTHTVLGLHTCTVALPCHVPQGPGMDYSIRVITNSITRLLSDSTRYYYESILPSDAKLDETGRAQNTVIAVLPTGQVHSQPTPTD